VGDGLLNEMVGSLEILAVGRWQWKFFTGDSNCSSQWWIVYGIIVIVIFLSFQR
jgi:hypothetical protein